MVREIRAEFARLIFPRFKRPTTLTPAFAVISVDWA
jgi:hypothetical protein